LESFGKKKNGTKTVLFARVANNESFLLRSFWKMKEDRFVQVATKDCNVPFANHARSTLRKNTFKLLIQLGTKLV